MRHFNNIIRRLRLMTGLLVAFNPASHAEDRNIKNIVLVHGAFTDGSSWSAVTARLQAKGYHVTAVQNPLTSLHEDVAATERVIERQKGSVLLVGHSWGGAVITQAGNAAAVKGLVYLSALVPDRGESVAQALARFGAPMQGMTADKQGLIWLDNAAMFQRLMANDLAAPQARLLAAVQQPITAAAFEEKVTAAAWRDKPSWYLITENDHALNAAVQARFARQINAHVSRVPSAHMSMMSHPAAVAELIDRAARRLH
ncbi:alpha/beta hydrolase [Kosakonia sp. BK9b]